MSGQTFRENVAQDLGDAFDRQFGRVWPMQFGKAHAAAVDWACERFGSGSGANETDDLT